MGGSSAGGGGGNTGADQGFFTSEKAKKEKQNDKNLGTSDYQGSLYSKEKSKTFRRVRQMKINPSFHARSFL